MRTLKEAEAFVVKQLSRKDEVGLKAVSRAILCIYNRQTEAEKRTGTHVRNGVGFSAADDKAGSYMARWVESGNLLSGRFLAQGRKMALKYRKQLAEEALQTWKRREERRNANRQVMAEIVKETVAATHKLPPRKRLNLNQDTKHERYQPSCMGMNAEFARSVKEGARQVLSKLETKTDHGWLN